MENKNVIEIPKGITNEEIIRLIFNERDYNILRDRMIGTLWWTNPYNEKERNKKEQNGTNG